MSSIRLEHVSKSYGSAVAVSDLTIDVPTGEFVTLLGPSGSGKTTTMRMIAGLERPDSGTVSIGDRIVSGPGTFVPTYRREIGMVFQSYAVWPHKTVAENVAFPLQRRGVPRDEQTRRVGAILDLVGLGRLAARYPSQLSGGQQQRVSLARALVGEPRVILFDEPLSNLDAQLRESMRDLLSDLHHRLRITSVYVTHDQTEAMVLSDRIYVMNGGVLVQDGTPRDLYERPQSVFVARFIGAANTLRIEDVDATAGRIRLEGGETLRVDRPLGECRERTLMARPHDISFARNDDFDNVIGGAIRSANYLGDRVRYIVGTDGGGAIAVDGFEPSIYGPGTRVRIKLPAEACIVL